MSCTTTTRFRAMGCDFTAEVEFEDVGEEFEADVTAVNVTHCDGVRQIPGFQLEFAELPERAQDEIFRAVNGERAQERAA